MKTHKVQPHLKPIPKIKNIMAIGSGKGGVGKSTTAINLACALQQKHGRVGLLDADIYGPNQPHLLGVKNPVNPVIDGQLTPVKAHHLYTMSIGYLIDKATAAIWRGPMVVKALKQLLFDTHWPPLDFLLIDLPPGTGDIQLSLAQHIPVVGSLIVTTPQTLALLDVEKSIAMFSKVHVPVLGIIENMSFYQCTHCKTREPIFGQGGGEQLAKKINAPLLGSLPLSKAIREQADSGQPLVISQPQSIESMIYQAIADQVVAIISERPIDYSKKFPQIVVESKEMA